MCEVTLEAEGAKCPIIKAWSDLPYLVTRATQAKLADLGHEGITRESVSANAELLEPIIKEFGNPAGNISTNHFICKP